MCRFFCAKKCKKKKCKKKCAKKDFGRSQFIKATGGVQIRVHKKGQKWQKSLIFLDYYMAKSKKSCFFAHFFGHFFGPLFAYGVLALTYFGQPKKVLKNTFFCFFQNTKIGVFLTICAHCFFFKKTQTKKVQKSTKKMKFLRFFAKNDKKSIFPVFKKSLFLKKKVTRSSPYILKQRNVM